MSRLPSPPFRTAPHASRREALRLLSLAGLTALLPGTAASAADFEAFVQGLWPQAQAAGVSRETFETATAGLKPETAVLAKPKAQAEFTISIPAYLGSAVTNSRVARGRAVAAQYEAPLARAYQRHGVPGEIIVAILGVESNFGTLAWKGHRAETFISEFVDALVMLEKGYATRGQLRGSWAGAMGQPQFMPSAYLKFAESDDGAGAPDIWRSHADAIASIANFLAKSGWVAGVPAVTEVRLPEGFDYAAFDLDFGRWRALGLARADGEALPASGAASLYLPAGAAGPAFHFRQFRGHPPVQHLGRLRHVGRRSGRAHRRARHSSRCVAPCRAAVDGRRQDHAAVADPEGLLFGNDRRETRP